jgi:hypothetical protein
MPERRLQRLVAVALVPTAALFAGVLIALRLHFQPPRVPEYFVADPGPDVRTLAHGDEFSITLRPAASVDGAVGVRAFLLRGDEVRGWDPPFAAHRDGSLTIGGPVDTLFSGVPSGRWDVAVAVGRPEVLPTAPRDILRARGRDAGVDAAWRLLVVPVRLETAGN